MIIELGRVSEETKGRFTGFEFPNLPSMG